MKFSADEIHRACSDLFSKYPYRYKDVDILYISQLFIAEYLLGLYEERELTKILKRYSLDDWARYLFYEGTRIVRSVVPQVGEESTVFFFEIKNQSMIENLYSQYAYMRDAGVPVTLLSNNSRLLREPSCNVFEFAAPRHSLQHAFRIRADLKRAAREVSHELAGKFEALDEKRFARYLYRQLCTNIFVVDTVERYMQRRSAKRYVLATDVHKWSRTLALLAERDGVPTYVLQHGATVLAYGYLPVTTHHFLAWGELSRRWMVERGADPSRIVLAGSPKFDKIYEMLRDLACTETHILVVVNPIGKERTEAFFETILPALRRLGRKTIVKLHPSTDDYRELVEAYCSDALFEIQKHSDTLRLIADAVAVVTTTSSVAVETIMIGKPLCQVKQPNLPVLEYEAYGCQHAVESSDALYGILNDRQGLQAKRERYRRFLADYCGQLDGQDRARISEIIEKEPIADSTEN